jgi:ribosomal protein S18 acetylase RimI-like enzyme
MTHPPVVRRAGQEDADAVARLLHAFNREFDTPTPDPPALAARVRELQAPDDFVVLLVGDGPDGLAVLRLRPSLWSTNLECYLAELYVVPPLRGRGLGRALLLQAIAVARAAGADHMDLGTSEDDVAARALYESAGLTRHEGGPDGPVMSVYEREL